MIEPRALQVDLSEGATLGVLQWGSDPTAPPLVLLHPNGFCGGVFAPLAERLQYRYSVHAVDLRGHGTSFAPPPDPSNYGYLQLAGDVLRALDQLGIHDPLVVGQSLGGAVAVLIDVLRPGWARRIVLCEAAAYEARPAASSNPLADQARRRRAEWPSRAAMLEAYASRPTLAELAPEALQAYIDYGTRVTEAATVELCCKPDVEAVLFELAATQMGGAAALGHLSELTSPVAVLAGADSFLPTEFFHCQASAAGVDLHVVPGGHFFLQSDADAAARLLIAQFEHP